MKFRAIESNDLPAISDVRASTRENPFSREALRDIGITEKSTAEMLRTTHRGWLCEAEKKIVGFAVGDGKQANFGSSPCCQSMKVKGLAPSYWRKSRPGCIPLAGGRYGYGRHRDPRRRAFSFYSKRGWSVSERKAEIVYMKKQIKHL